MVIQPLSNPTSNFGGVRREWRAQEDMSQTRQEFFHITQQPRFTTPPFNRSGLSTQSYQASSHFIPIEEQHNWWQRIALYKIPKDESVNGWIADAIDELKHIDGEVAEEALPEISADTKEKARRIIIALPKHLIAPTIYPTMDGEIAIYFKSPDVTSSVLILVGNGAQAACFSYIKGKNRRARYEDSSDLPDEFVKEQLRALEETLLSKDI